MERFKKSTRFSVLMGLALIVSLSGTPLAAQTIGMVVGQSGGITVFDASSDTVLGTTAIPGGTIGDCSITADQSKGFVTRFDSKLYVVDLTTPSAPVAAAGPNPIAIANNGEDTSITPDEQFVLVCDGSANQSVSVVDIATQTEVSTFSLGTNCNSVDVCSDGSVLVTSVGGLGNTVRRLTIDGAGNLTDTLESLSLPNPNNVFCSPDAASGVGITRGTNQIRSFLIPGLAPADTRTLTGGFGISGDISPANDRVFARTTSGAKIDVYGYISASGALTPTPIYSVGTSNTPTFYGMDQLAVHPDGSKFYVSKGSGAVDVYDSAFGNLLTTIVGPANATGVCFANQQSCETKHAALFNQCLPAKNHGQFVSCVAKLTNSLKKQGLITGAEKGEIQSCAAQADLP